MISNVFASVIVILPPTLQPNVENGWLYFAFRKQIGISQQRSFPFFNPSMYLRYKLDYHWTFSLYGSLKRSAEDSPTCIRDSTKPITAPGDGKRTFPSLGRKPTISTESTKTLYRNFHHCRTNLLRRSNRNTLFRTEVSKMPLSYTRRELPNHNDSWNLSSTFLQRYIRLAFENPTHLLPQSHIRQRLADSEGNRQSLLADLSL